MDLRRILDEYRAGRRGMPTYAELAQIAYRTSAADRAEPVADEEAAYMCWATGQQGVPYDGSVSFARAAWMFRASQQAAPLPGYALVPVEPTTDMLYQMASAYLDQHGYGDSFIKGMYKAAIAAAQPGTVNHG
ncbi:hypothetical protein [Ralstonia syzygii]|uniref:hypothetical protein n=1 Tax=Ralstonia syzygii TaxID=28097 RepID=UPI0035142E06